MRTVQLSVGDSQTLFVQFCTDGDVIKSFTFWNFIGNGDTLAKASFEWIVLNILPEETKGLIEIKS